MSKNIAVSSTYLSINETKNLIKLSFKQFRALGGPGKYVPLCLWGHAGIGKTAGVNQAANEIAAELEKEFGRPVRILVQNHQLSCMQPFDLGGYPYTEVTKLKSGSSITLQNFATPRWMVEGELEDYDFVFTFLDEINRARPEMHNTIMGVLDGRGVNGHKLRNNYFVIAAANPVTDDSAYGAVTEMADQAILDRMVHVNVIPSQDEYLQFLKDKHDKNDSMYNFLISERDGFGGGKKEKSMWPKNDFVSITSQEDKITNTNRGGDVIESAMPFIGHMEKLREAFAKGVLGDIVGQKFSDTYNKNVILIKPEEIIEKPTKTTYQVLSGLVNKDGTGTSRHDEVAKINDTVVGYLNRTGRKELTKKQVENLKKYLEEIPHDFREIVVTKANFIGDEKKAFSPMRQEILKTSSAKGTVLGDLEFR
jgi:hypothetical protein